MNHKAINIIESMLERIMERGIEVYPLNLASIDISQDPASLHNELILRVTKDLNLSMKAGTLLELIQLSTGATTCKATKGKLLSPIEHYFASTLLSEIWQELTQEKVLDGLAGLTVGIKGVTGCIRFSYFSPELQTAKAQQTPGSMRRAINPLPELRHFFASLSRSHKIAQLCQNLQNIPALIISDLIKGETPAVAALLLRFLEESRVDAALKSLGNEMREAVLESRKDMDSSIATDLMLTTLAFMTYAPMSPGNSETPNTGQGDKKHLAVVN